MKDDLKCPYCGNEQEADLTGTPCTFSYLCTPPSFKFEEREVFDIEKSLARRNV